MNIQEKIQRLIEQRQIEAVGKNLTRKILTVVNTLGFDMIDQHGSDSSVDGFSVSTQGHSWLLESDDEEQIPVSYDTPTVIGRYFDGLSYGVNVQIKFREDAGSVQLTHDGILVYLEQHGKLECYVPMPVWESQLDYFYAISQKQIQKFKERPVTTDIEIKRQSQTRLLDYLQKFWGFRS